MSVSRGATSTRCLAVDGLKKGTDICSGMVCSEGRPQRGQWDGVQRGEASARVGMPPRSGLGETAWRVITTHPPMHAAPVLLSLSLLSLSSGQSSSPSPSPAPSLVTTCTFNNGSTSFGQWDLSPLTQMASTYITTDLRDSTKKYYYNFCSA